MSWYRARVWLFSLLLLMAAGCSTYRSVEERISEFRELTHGLYFLEFDRYGNLTNPEEIDHALRAAKTPDKPPVKRVIVLSLGWDYDRNSIRERYVELVGSYAEFTGAGEKSKDESLADTVVFCVAWDSAQLGFRRFTNDVIPFATFADTLAAVPDAALFPLSFWSKAALADRIGRTGLRDALEAFIGGLAHRTPDNENGTSEEWPGQRRVAPGIYLIGHSFGCRILSSLILNALGTFPSETYAKDRFAFDHRVKAALFIQPAMVELNMSDRVPTVVTQSRHDHANGIVFPLANIPFNAYGATEWEGLFGRVRNDENFTKIFRDTMGLPFSVGWSAIGMPINYVHAQAWEVWNRPLDYPFDTLAQLPLVEIPIELIDQWVVAPLAGEARGWGKRHKGLFNLGAVNESVARTATPHLWGFSIPPTIDLDEAIRDAGAGLRDAMRTSDHYRRAVYVDCSDAIKQGSFGFDMDHPIYEYLLSWLDPIGAHSDFVSKPMLDLMRIVLDGGLTGPPAAPSRQH